MVQSGGSIATQDAALGLTNDAREVTAGTAVAFLASMIRPAALCVGLL